MVDWGIFHKKGVIQTFDIQAQLNSQQRWVPPPKQDCKKSRPASPVFLVQHACEGAENYHSIKGNTFDSKHEILYTTGRSLQ